MYDTFLSYEASAIALACVSLADRAAAVSGHGSLHLAFVPPALSAPLAVAATAGLKVDQIAPGLESCVEALDKCFVAYCNQRCAAPQPAA